MTKNQPQHWNMSRYKVQFEHIVNLRQSEHIDPTIVEQLKQQITEEGVWRSILPVEASSGLVMDGNHRLHVARQLELLRLPIIRLEYKDSCVRVNQWSNGKPYDLNRIAWQIETGAILPYKTTRHTFLPALPEVSFPLELLSQPMEPLMCNL
ncbi:MAG: transcriptional regulator [Pseudomonadota bacterium]